jgi:hypothetical protein
MTKPVRFDVSPWAAQGIEAEIPQASRVRRAEELERKARFFAARKMRPNSF